MCMLPLSVFTILIVIALLLTIFSFFASQYPLVRVAILLVCVALLVSHTPLVK